MGHHKDNHACIHKDALNVLSEFILIGSLNTSPPEPAGFNDRPDGLTSNAKSIVWHQNNGEDIEMTILFINESLRRELGHAHGEASTSTCTIHINEEKHGKHHGQITLTNAQGCCILLFDQSQLTTPITRRHNINLYHLTSMRKHNW